MRRIADAVHGPITLTPVESKIVDTAAFQRLRGVKQLGLAHLVFPGADYSRFAHCIGVCDVTGRILDAVQAHDSELDERKRQRYRLAGLLHDIGHYPFSHAFEEALENWSKGHRVLLSTEASDAQSADALPPSPPLTHEAVSQAVLERDDQIAPILEEAGFSGQDIARVFRHQEELTYTNLVSSDLDADRIDYLLRTAHHTKLPYGSVDLDYLLGPRRHRLHAR